MKRQFRIKTTEDAVVCMISSKTRAIVPCKISIAEQIEEDCAWGPRSRIVPTAAAQIFDLEQTNQSAGAHQFFWYGMLMQEREVPIYLLARAGWKSLDSKHLKTKKGATFHNWDCIVEPLSLKSLLAFIKEFFTSARCIIIPIYCQFDFGPLNGSTYCFVS